MSTARTMRRIIAIGAISLALSACVPDRVLPNLPRPWDTQVQLAEGDVITLGTTDFTFSDLYGFPNISFDEKTVTHWYTLPEEGGEIFRVEGELPPEDRAAIVSAAEDYLSWEENGARGAPEDPCMDMSSTGVEVTGSVSFNFARQNCGEGLPLSDLVSAAHDAPDPRVPELATPGSSLAFQVRPIGPASTGASVQHASYELRSAWGFEDGMRISSSDAPDTWGTGLQDSQEPGELILGWTLTGDVLRAHNQVAIEAEEIACDDASAEIVIGTIDYSGEIQETFTIPVCPGTSSEALEETLRGL